MKAFFDMERKYFEEDTFEGISFVEIKKEKVEYLNCIFRKCDFTYAKMKDCLFEDCIFEKCNFSMTNMEKSVHNHSSFKGCKLQGVGFDLSSSFMFQVSFEDCSLSYVSFNEKKMPQTTFRKSTLTAVDFTGCNLSKSLFADCDLTDSIFSETVLEQVDFRTAHNYIIDPRINRLKGAQFDSTGVSGLLEIFGVIIS